MAELGLFGCDMCFALCFYHVSLVRHDQIGRDGKDLVHEMSFVYKSAVQDVRRKTQRNVSCVCLKKNCEDWKDLALTLVALSKALPVQLSDLHPK